MTVSSEGPPDNIDRHAVTAAVGAGMELGLRARCRLGRNLARGMIADSQRCRSCGAASQVCPAGLSPREVK